MGDHNIFQLNRPEEWEPKDRDLLKEIAADGSSQIVARFRPVFPRRTKITLGEYDVHEL